MMLPLFFFLLFTLSLTLAAPGINHDALFARDDKFFMASIGDSWAAGAAVNDQQKYDSKNDDKCFRNKDAWEAQMAGDNTWTINPIDFKFLACSGADLNIPSAGYPDKIGKPHLLTMQLGANNVHLAEIVRTCIFLGDNGANPDNNSSCLEILDKWQVWITSGNDISEGLFTEFNDALDAISDWKSVRNRQDFYLYVVGYAEFFNTSPESDWCNDVTFGMIGHPKLTKELRYRINSVVHELNSMIEMVINDRQGDFPIRFLDPTDLFTGHLFCEPHHSLNDQYFSDDVWFWNSSPADDDGTTNVTIQNMWIQKQTFANGNKASKEQIKAIVGGSDPYSSGRTFHPKKNGHTAIKNGVISLLEANGVPGVGKPPPPPPAPYASGRALIHVKEFWGCPLDSWDNLSVEVEMWDHDGKLIGNMTETHANDSAPANVRSLLEHTLVVTPEWKGEKGGYIQFALGNLSFNSMDDTDVKKDTYCTVGGWDPKQGPYCADDDDDGKFEPALRSMRQMDCLFPAPDWHGGKPTAEILAGSSA